DLRPHGRQRRARPRAFRVQATRSHGRHDADRVQGAEQRAPLARALIHTGRRGHAPFSRPTSGYVATRGHAAKIPSATACEANREGKHWKWTMASTAAEEPEGVRALPRGARFSTDVPARLDRLPWSRWHWRVVIALGITWMLDGLEVTLVGAIGDTLRSKSALGLSASQVGLTASAYLAGAVFGAILFGRLTDLFGRRRLFFVTLSVYLLATLATALSWSFASFAIFRAITGAGIGGEYSAVNSAIDELLPARVRGHADLAINATYWLGTALGAIVSIVLLNPRVIPHAIGWRACFGLGAV